MSINHILVVGAGQMGAGIAQVALQAGFQVTLSDVAEAALAKGKAGIEKGLSKLVEKGKLDAAAKDAALKNLSLANSILDVKNVDAAIEAVTENEELKKKIFKDLDQVVRPGGLLATMSASIHIASVSPSARTFSRIAGFMFQPAIRRSGSTRRVTFG